MLRISSPLEGVWGPRVRDVDSLAACPYSEGAPEQFNPSMSRCAGWSLAQFLQRPPSRPVSRKRLMQTTPDRQKRPRIFYGWYIVAASFASNVFVSGAYWQGFQVFFLPILREFGWSRAALSGAFSLRQVEVGAFAPFLGFIVDRYGPKRVIMASGFLLGLGMILVAQTFSIWSFYLFFMVASIGASGTSHAIGWAVAISRWFKRRRGIALGIGMSGPIMTGVVLFFLAWFVDQYGWRNSMMGTGVLLWITVIPMAMLIKESPESVGLLPDGDIPEPVVAESGGVANRPLVASEQGYSAGDALRSKPFWIVSIIFASMFFGTSAIQVHQVPFFESEGFSTTEAAVTVSLVFFLSGFGRIGAGYLADLVDIRYLLAFMAGFHVLAWFYLSVAGTGSLWAAVPFTVLFGVPFGAMVSVRPIILAQLFGTRALGSLSGMLQATALASGIVAPVFMGWVFDVRDDYGLAIQAFILTTAVAIPMPFMLKPMVAQDSQESEKSVEST